MRGALIAAFTMKKMDGGQKKFFSQLAIDTKFFHWAFVNPCPIYN
jgi:hypothetical protein